MSHQTMTLIKLETILQQMKACVCKIKCSKNSFGTGFLCKIPLPYTNCLIPVLITNNHVINSNNIIENKIIEISLNNEQIQKKLYFDNSRFYFTNKNLDITFIEIKKEDDINSFLELDDSINDKNMNKIYLLHYPQGKEITYSLGEIINFKTENLKHNCQTIKGSSGSPIINLKTCKVIGVHKGCRNFCKIGIYIKRIINEFHKTKYIYDIKYNNYLKKMSFKPRLNNNLYFFNMPLDSKFICLTKYRDYYQKVINLKNPKAISLYNDYRNCSKFGISTISVVDEFHKAIDDIKYNNHLIKSIFIPKFNGILYFYNLFYDWKIIYYNVFELYYGNKIKNLFTENTIHKETLPDYSLINKSDSNLIIKDKDIRLKEYLYSDYFYFGSRLDTSPKMLFIDLEPAPLLFEDEYEIYLIRDYLSNIIIEILEQITIKLELWISLLEFFKQLEQYENNNLDEEKELIKRLFLYRINHKKNNLFIKILKLRKSYYINNNNLFIYNNKREKAYINKLLFFIVFLHSYYLLNLKELKNILFYNSISINYKYAILFAKKEIVMKNTLTKKKNPIISKMIIVLNGFEIIEILLLLILYFYEFISRLYICKRNYNLSKSEQKLIIIKDKIMLA